MWELYDELIDVIPRGIKLIDIYQTERWTFVMSDNNVGTAMKFDKKIVASIEKYKGLEIYQVAKLIKSWDFQEASIGLAAINSYVNQQKHIQKQFYSSRINSEDAFTQLINYSQKNKIGMVGHFPYVDRLEIRPKNIYIFELEPRKGDYPASASEFLLPEMDIVYITASTLINKTLPRLLELAKNATTILVGSSCPLCHTLYHSSIDVLAGTLYQKSIKELVGNKNKTQFPLSKYGVPLMINRKGG